MIEDLLKKPVEQLTQDDIKKLEEAINPLKTYEKSNISLDTLKYNFAKIAGSYSEKQSIILKSPHNNKYLKCLKVIENNVYEITYDDINICFFKDIIPIDYPVFTNIFGESTTVKTVKFKINCSCKTTCDIIDNLSSMEFIYNLTSEINKFKYFYKAVISPDIEILDKSILNEDGSFDIKYLSENGGYLKISNSKFNVMIRVA